MLKIVYDRHDLELWQLAEVYTQSNRIAGESECPISDQNAQLLYGEQLFYDYVMFFLEDPASYIAIWEVDGRYVSALRMEPFEDGLLLTGLETHPVLRRKGYGEMLVKAVLQYVDRKHSCNVYSHVDKKNMASLTLHEKCGFVKIADGATYIDGSYHSSSVTLQYPKM